ncbi:MAG: riboflavin biosynthesis protein RibF [Candidatus Methylacidiphilales bacterium]
MHLYQGYPSACEGSVIRHLALGFFDGLHLGHRSVILNPHSLNHLEQTAVLTFWPHPMTVLTGQKPPDLITTLEEKTAILQSWKIGHTAVLDFNNDMAMSSPEVFLDAIAVAFPNMVTLSVGPNFRFAHRRAGTPVTLADWCRERGVQFHLTDYMMDGATPISSTRIRELLREGKLDEATRMMGHPYPLTGHVVRGEGNGRHIGFPTANFSLAKTCLLPDGVYLAEWIDAQAIAHPVALNIGFRPTLGKHQTRSVEAHVIDFHSDLYGQHLQLQVLKFLRAEQKFPDVEALKDQIRRDVETCRERYDSWRSVKE